MTMPLSITAAFTEADLIDQDAANEDDFDAVRAARREAHELHWLVHGDGRWRPVYR